VAIVLATGPNVRGFKPSRGQWVFKSDKNPQQYLLWRGSKAVGHMSQDFTIVTSQVNFTDISRQVSMLVTASELRLANQE
jgi:hypothetical protein